MRLNLVTYVKRVWKAKGWGWVVHQRVRVGEHEIKQKGEGGKGEWWGSMRENIKGKEEWCGGSDSEGKWEKG